MTSVQDLFNVSDQLIKNLEIPHKLAVPKLSKIVVNAGIGKIKEDNKAIEKMKKDKYEFWYDEKGRVVGKQLICEDYGYDDLDDEL